ncbi:MAG: alpha/beta fold hydrolase [Hyphomicrobiaceae bacterium]
MAEIPIECHDAGAGEPAIVLVHGFCSGPEDWRFQVEHLAQHHHVIAPGLRGHGITMRGSSPMSIEQLATDCLDLMDEKGAQHAIVGGHSMGTRIAIEMCRQAPKRVRGLILVDGSNTTAKTDLEAALASYNDSIVERGYTAVTEALFAQMTFDPKHDAMKQAFIVRARAVPEAIGLPLYRNLIVWDGTVARDVLAATRVPILVLQSTTRETMGSRRTLQPGERGAYETLVLDNAPHADVVGFSGLGHYTMLEAPDEVNAAIDAWSDEHSLR